MRLESGIGVVSLRDLRASRRDLDGTPSGGLGGGSLVLFCEPGVLLGAVGRSIFASSEAVNFRVQRKRK